MIGLAQKHVPIRLAPRLAQAGKVFRVVVLDERGHPVSGVDVSAWSGGSSAASGITDSSGEVQLAVGNGPYDIRTVYGSRNYTLWTKASSDDVARGGDLFVKLPFCTPQPILTTSEGVALVLGAAVAFAGFHWKIEAAKVAGEVLIGASIFTTIYRLSCV